MPTTIEVNVKSSSQKYVISIENDKTILDLKNEIAKKTEVPAENQRLIFSGRILKDPATLEESNIANGHTVHMVKSGGTTNKTNASTSSNNNASSTNTTASSAPPSSQPQQPTTQQAPNPNPFAGFAGMPNDSQSNPYNMFGAGFGAGAMGNSFGSMMDPNMMNQMLQNPMFAQYMSSVLQNPGVLDSIIQTNPQLAGMGPEIRAMMQTPEFRQMLSNPDMIRQMATMAGAMQNMGMGGGMPGAGAGAFNPFAAMAQTQTQTPSSPNTTQTSSTPQQPQQQQNPFASFGNVPPVDPQLQQRMAALFGMGAGGAAAPASPADTRPPEERFQVQLQQLNDMGFWEAAKNIRALQATGGNVEAAIDLLLSGNL
ncbi:hypothetical protein BDF20DRAFT_869670 [Mycotypha africana]|uniref:uncharacterized protein n=1 Tax=Mycotypha africana TaxID=64632 RepID=UPI00230197FB|nr:uncharacterized protein BDF20DRAFT_869670 [Mycotypha africana]KAI8979460.1 hypothetical protein BDF20DRAFT_869670 [Mycotypha africana]